MTYTKSRTSLDMDETLARLIHSPHLTETFPSHFWLIWFGRNGLSFWVLTRWPIFTKTIGLQRCINTFINVEKIPSSSNVKRIKNWLLVRLLEEFVILLLFQSENLKCRGREYQIFQECEQNSDKKNRPMDKISKKQYCQDSKCT